MFANFDALCTSLGINSSAPSTEDLHKLINWCEATVSTDHHSEGEFKKRFASYQDFASDILINLHSTIQADKLMEPLPAFKGMTPLQYIVNKGLDIYLKKLKPSSEQINTKVKGFTLLQFAASGGNLHTTEALLSLGADPQEQTTIGDSILFNALILPISFDEKMKQHKEAIYVLLSKFCKNIAHEKNETGDTILHIMAIYGYDKLVREMLSKTKELASISNNLGHYPIHSAILNGQHDCAKLLLAVQGIERLTDAKGRNALHYAARYGDKDMVKMCLHSAIPKDKVDAQNQTPLILAVLAHNKAAVEHLLDAGVEVNCTDDSGKSPLHYAVAANNVELVKLLLKSSHIDVNINDGESHHPLDLVNARTPEDDEISKLLIAKGATRSKDQPRSMK